MWPELGRYAYVVLGAYGVTAALVGGIVAASLVRARRVKGALAAAEAARGARR
jgi:heme exporter protein D